MRVVQGRGKIRLGNEWRDFGVGDGEVRIGRGVVHDVCRADSEEEGEGDGVDFVWEERVEPGAFCHLFPCCIALIRCFEMMRVCADAVN